MFAGLQWPGVEQLDLHRGPEALHHGVVQAITDSAEAGEQAGRADLLAESPGIDRHNWMATLPVRELVRFVGVSPRKLWIGVRLLRKISKWKFVPTTEQVGWIAQFTDRPSTERAFRGWTGDIYQNLASNTARLDSVRSIDCPVTVAFGRHDPYITPAVATEIADLFQTSRLEFLEAGHWLQLELPGQVAEIVSRAIQKADR